MARSFHFVFKNYSKKNIFISILTTYLVLFNLFFVFEKSWPGELWISFLPYWLVLSIISTILLLIFVLFNWFKYWRFTTELQALENDPKISSDTESDEQNVVLAKINKLNSFKQNPVLNIFCGFVLVISCFSTTILSLRVYDYFYQPPQVAISTQIENGLKIGFFNILETNTEYNLVNIELAALNLDIIAFAEFQDNHYQNLPFLKTYSHSFPKTFPKVSGSATTIAIFSKLPFNQVSYKKLIHNNALVAKFEYNNSPYELIVNHLSNPAFPRFYENRNQDLAYLSRLLEDKKDEKVIVLGDFNTTPWSPYFPEFKDYNNVLAGRGPYITWQVGPLVLPIDQLFISQQIQVKNFKIDSQNGSDHHLIWATLV